MVAAQKKSLSAPLALAIIITFAPSAGYTACTTDSENIYQLFVEYREQVNSATRLEDLNHYFSDNFNNYYLKKLDAATTETDKGRLMARYWDNLNTARDIIIVFDYSLNCDKQLADLKLISVLSSKTAVVGQEVELWKVTVRYRNENDQWKIDSFEYDKLGRGQEYLATDIKNNFVLIR
jgi:hypothetical protein